MDLVQCVKGLIYRDPFYGNIALGLQKEFSNKVPTACAALEGININLYFNEEFFNKQNDKQKIGLMQHELGHVCLFHLTHMSEYEDKELFNIAADMVINQYIDGDYLPNNAFLPSAFPELKMDQFKDTRYYYDKMKEDLKSNGGPGKSEKLGKIHSHMTNGGMTIASHPLWGKDKDGNEVSQAVMDLAKSQIEHQIKEVYEEALQRNPGSLPGYMRDFVLNLYIKTPPVIDWRLVVRQFKSFCDKQTIRTTRSKPNKRFPEFDAVTLRQKQRMLVGIDTSGSISPKLLNEFFVQILHISKTGAEVDVCEWDAKVGRVFEFNQHKPFQIGQVTGGGGTDPTDFVELLNKSSKYNAAISMSDGFVGGSYAKLSKPMLWIISKGGNVNFNFPGKKILTDI
jgi:predicted metal-dependent peptidase